MAGLRPGLLQKYQNAVTADEKFALLKAFMLDPLSMADVTIEASYVELSKEEDKAKWVELPLSQLRKEFTSEAEKRFLQEKLSMSSQAVLTPKTLLGRTPKCACTGCSEKGRG